MDLNAHAGKLLADLRAQRPMVHHITNLVVTNDTANVTLHLGAQPVMAHAMEEVEEMAAMAGALVLNIGTLSAPWIAAMMAAGRRANALGIPVVLDPVGAGATAFRTGTCTRMLNDLKSAWRAGTSARSPRSRGWVERSGAWTPWARARAPRKRPWPWPGKGALSRPSRARATW